MAIIFREQTKQFYLHTDNSSYIIELLEGKIPLHAYWGPRLDNMPPLTTWKSSNFMNFNALDIPTSAGGDFQCAGSLPLELPTYGAGDMRQPAFHAQYADGSRITKLEYVGHTITSGKPGLEGLPATYGGAGQVDTLELHLYDALQELSVYLQYSVFPAQDAVTRSVRVVNESDNLVRLLKVASANVDFYDMDADMLHLHGLWARERHVQRVPLTNTATQFGSLRGASSHLHNPFFALLSPDTTETTGDAYGFSLVYSGNFLAEAEKDAFNMVRASIGLGGLDFAWNLNSGDSFQSPEAVLVYAADGIGGMSRRYHRLYRDHLCRGRYQHKERPVLVNNWEATYFQFNEEKLLTIAEKAKALDIDMLVLDDGWFGKRNQDNCSLGDWYVNTEKLPGGLKGLGDKLNAMGMKFGLWFEPEMVSPDSDLYRAHPDWCLHVEGRSRSLSRSQLILDMSRADVQEYVINTVCGVLNSAPIAYVKWDMNRNFSEAGSALLPPEQQQEVAHRYMLGLYRVLETITSRHPEVLFESCAGGGGRYDPGMLYYMPQTWCSDDTDGVERLYIQYGTSMVYPAVSMGSHVSACPNHQVGRTTPFKMRGDVAMSGQFGYELDLSRLSEADLALAKEQVAFYKKYRHVVQWGDMYRLCSPFEEPFAAWEYVAADGNTALLCTYVVAGKPNVGRKRVKLQGLDATAEYKVETDGRVYSGAFLMQVGLAFDRNLDHLSNVTVLTKM